jgi:hypothetical protein
VTRQDVEEIKGHFDRVADGLRSEMTGLRQGLREEIAQQGAELRAEMAGLRQALREEIDGARREAGVTADGRRSEIRQVAEGVALANERIDRLDLRVDDLTGEVRRGFASVRADFRRLHETDDDLRRRIEAQERRGA